MSWRQIDMPGANVALARLDLPADARQRLLTELAHGTPWEIRHITLFGRRMPQPRLVAWYGDAHARYRYSGESFEPLPWTPALAAVRTLVEAQCRSHFDSVLLNCYRDGRDSMGQHADDEPELGPAPTIASLSLGATRTLTFRHRLRRDLPTVKLDLHCGDLLVMRGDTQRNWKHGITRTRRPVGTRINLTFRRIVG